MAQMKSLAYALHESGQCDPPECAWCDPPSVPPVHDRPQSVEAGSNLPPGGDGGSLAERLEDALAADVPFDQAMPGHWEVTDPGSADWALRKLGKVDAEAHAVSELAEQQIAAIEAWRGAEHKRLGTQRENWETLLAVYHRALLAEDEKAKTIRLPHGTLTARKLPDGIVIEDEEALLKWASAEAVDYVRVRVDLNHSAIKAAVLKSGEIIPGVEVVEGQVKYSVAPN